MLDFIFYFFIFLVSILFLYLSSEWLVKSLTEIAQFLGWREFIFALFVMAFIGSLPNLFIGINSVIQRQPVFSLGEIFGGNIVDLTLAIGIAALVSINGLRIESKTVQGTAAFTLVIAILPIILIGDNYLSRTDGLVLLLAFASYIFWLFSKGSRFTRAYEKEAKKLKLKDISEDLCIMLGSLILLFLAAKGIVVSSIFFADGLGLPLVLIGILIVGFANALPEIFFSMQSAKKGDDWMVIGSLMGAVISASTLVLGIIIILHPIQICPYVEAPLLTIARFFLIIAALFFFYLFFIKSSRKITKNEGLALIIVYVVFVIVQVLVV